MSKHPSVLFGFLRAFIALSIIGGGLSIAAWFTLNPAHTGKVTTHEKKITYVTTMPISFGNYPVRIDAMGKVSAAKEMALKSQVSGEIISVSEHFIPGGFFRAGETILKIDPSDYKLAVKSARASVNQANAAFRLEEGQQQIAKNEIEILQRNTGKTLKSTDLALRKPQLEQAKATLDAAKASLDGAFLDLKRTKLTAPFDVIVTERNTDLGNIVTAQSALATLVATDEYWVTLDVPLSDLPWLSFPTNTVLATKALITLGDLRGTREGEIFNQSGVVDENTRLTSVLVRVVDPLLINDGANDGANNVGVSSPLTLGDYVPVTLIGKTLEGAARIPPHYIHQSDEGNFDVVWLAQGGRLVIQPIVIAYKDRNYAYVTGGLDYNSALITSNIVTPVSGMDIKIHNDNGDK